MTSLPENHPDPSDGNSRSGNYRRLNPKAGEQRSGSEQEVPSYQPNPEPEWGKKRRQGKSVWHWIGLASALTAVALAFHLFMRIREDRAPEIEKIPSEFPKMNFMETANGEQLDHAIEKTVRGYLEATTDAERCRFIIDGDRKEEKMREFFQRKDVGAAPHGFGKIIKTEPASIGGRSFMVALASGQEVGQAWLLQLVPTETEMKIDWEATVSYGEVSWTQFLKERSDKPVQMRVYLEGIRAPLSSGIPDKLYRTFEVSMRGQKAKIVTHLRRGSLVERELVGVVPAQAVQPVNLRLQWTDDTEGTRRLEIVELIHNYWIAPHPSGK